MTVLNKKCWCCGGQGYIDVWVGEELYEEYKDNPYDFIKEVECPSCDPYYTNFQNPQNIQNNIRKGGNNEPKIPN